MRLLRGFLASALLHGLLFILLISIIRWNEAHASQEIGIDLAGSSLLLRPKSATANARPVPPQEPWVLALPGHATPKPVAQAQPLTVEAEATGPVCPPPCPTTPGDWLPAAAASRKPKWDNPISDDDYPSDLRLKGVEGKVVVDVLIDAQGNVRGVTLIQGAAEEFNQLVLSRLQNSKFQPAYDQDGNPISCRIRLPLLFTLKD